MKVKSLFNNIISKDLISYDCLFDSFIYRWKFDKSDAKVLVITDNLDGLNKTLIDINNNNKKVEFTSISSHNNHFIIKSICKYQQDVEKFIEFTTLDIHSVKNYIKRGMRYDQIIIDVDNKELYDLDLPISSDFMKDILIPTSRIIKCYDENFITLYY